MGNVRGPGFVRGERRQNQLRSGLEKIERRVNAVLDADGTTGDLRDAL